MKNTSLDLVRVTESAAIAASKWVGSGNKEMADKAATDAMRKRLNKMNFAGRIIIGEGEKDESYGLFFGEELGLKAKRENKKGIKYHDIAVDPIEGTRPTVTSGPEAISAISLAKPDSMYVTDAYYMKKIAYGNTLRKRGIELSLEYSLYHNLRLTSIGLRKKMQDIVVCVLDRPRHADIIEELRQHKVRIKLIQDCDISGAISACLPDSGIDFMYGIGGAPEAILSACALKCLRGGMECMTVNSQDWTTTSDILKINNLVKGPCVFAATGITDGSMLKGVKKYKNSKTTTNSVFMRSESGTVRWIEAEHGN